MSRIKNLAFLYEVTKHLDETHGLEVCYTDLSKAFGPVNYDYLDHKMNGNNMDA